MTGSVDKYMVKLFFVGIFAALMLFFSIIFSLHFMIVEKSVSDCNLQLEDDAFYSLGRGVNSKSMAEKIVVIYAENNKDDADIRFLKSTLETCGSAYVFIDKSDNMMYAVCGDGKMYRYACVPKM